MKDAIVYCSTVMRETRWGGLIWSLALWDKKAGCQLILVKGWSERLEVLIVCCVWCYSDPNMSVRRGSAFPWQTRSKDETRIRGWEEQFLQVVMTWPVAPQWLSNKSQSWYSKNVKGYQRLSKPYGFFFVIVVGFFRPVSMIFLGWPLNSGVTSVHPLSCLNLLVFDRILLSYCSLNEVNSLHLVSIPLIEKSLDL